MAIDFVHFEVYYKCWHHTFNKSTDPLVLFFHFCLIQNKYKCLVESQKTELLPNNWNETEKMYELKYKKHGIVFKLSVFVTEPNTLHYQLKRESDQALFIANSSINKYVNRNSFVDNNYRMVFKDMDLFYTELQTAINYFKRLSTKENISPNSKTKYIGQLKLADLVKHLKQEKIDHEAKLEIDKNIAAQKINNPKNLFYGDNLNFRKFTMDTYNNLDRAALEIISSKDSAFKMIQDQADKSKYFMVKDKVETTESRDIHSLPALVLPSTSSCSSGGGGGGGSAVTDGVSEAAAAAASKLPGKHNTEYYVHNPITNYFFNKNEAQKPHIDKLNIKKDNFVSESFKKYNLKMCSITLEDCFSSELFKTYGINRAERIKLPNVILQQTQSCRNNDSKSPAIGAALAAATKSIQLKTKNNNNNNNNNNKSNKKRQKQCGKKKTNIKKNRKKISSLTNNANQKSTSTDKSADLKIQNNNDEHLSDNNLIGRISLDTLVNDLSTDNDESYQRRKIVINEFSPLKMRDQRMKRKRITSESLNATPPQPPPPPPPSNISDKTGGVESIIQDVSKQSESIKNDSNKSDGLNQISIVNMLAKYSSKSSETASNINHHLADNVETSPAQSSSSNRGVEESNKENKIKETTSSIFDLINKSSDNNDLSLNKSTSESPLLFKLSRLDKSFTASKPPPNKKPRLAKSPKLISEMFKCTSNTSHNNKNDTFVLSESSRALNVDDFINVPKQSPELVHLDIGGGSNEISSLNEKQNSLKISPKTPLKRTGFFKNEQKINKSIEVLNLDDTIIDNDNDCQIIESPFC